jgi:hypothetical protein
MWNWWSGDPRSTAVATSRAETPALVAGDSGPGGRRLRPRSIALAILPVGLSRDQPGVGPETFCLWPETPVPVAGDSGLSGWARVC